MNINFEKLDQEIIKQMDLFQVPSISIGIVKKDEIVYKKSYGYRNIELKEKADTETVYPLASVTKAFTSASLGILKDRGFLDWDEPIKTYMPEFKMYDAFVTENLTLRDMLSHNTGLPRHDYLWHGYHLESKTTKKYVESLAYLKPNKGFRSKFEYNNIMFAVAGYVVEKITGDPWGLFLKKNILDPLKMKRTSSTWQEINALDNKVTPYARDDKGNLLALEIRNFDGVAACGTMNSCVDDMSQWIKLHLGNGVFEGKTIISKSTMDELHMPMVIKRDEPIRFNEIPITGYGFGWNIEVYRGYKVLSHSGGIDGISTYVTIVPKEDIGVVILSNRSNNGMIFALAKNILDRALNLSKINWYKRYEQVEKLAKKETIETKEKRENVKQPDTNPTRPLTSYAGKYNHKGYGELEVVLENEVLFITFNGIKSKLLHNNYDSFDLKIDWQDDTNYYITEFLFNNEGNVNQIGIDFEPALEELIYFTKE